MCDYGKCLLFKETTKARTEDWKALMYNGCLFQMLLLTSRLASNGSPSAAVLLTSSGCPTAYDLSPFRPHLHMHFIP